MKRIEPLSKKLKTIGGRMWLYREMVARIKGNEMAVKLGISPGAYSDLESSKKEPSAKVFIAYCAQPMMSIHWLLTGETKTETDKEIYRVVTGDHDFEIEEEEELGGLVGNEEIDRGRIYLVSLIDTIQAAGDSPLGIDIALNHVAELHFYTKAYFKLEEEIQKNIKFKGRTKHKAMHKQFINVLDRDYREIKSAQEGDHQALVLESASNFFKKWLFNHIEEEDLKMREYFY
jgi:hemerythrin-like metal-binding protein